MHLHYLQHVPFEDPAGILRWAEERGHGLTRTLLYADEPLPEIDAFGLLVVMGGPMSINDEAGYPWLVDEKRFIRAAIDRGRKVIGICLGAQLIANVLGAKIYANHCREIGLFDIELTDAGRASPLMAGLPDPCPAFHWHGETFDLPEGAVPLARTAACEHQAFSYDGRVLGLQFHLETTPESAAKLIEHCADDITVCPTVQTAQAMRQHVSLDALPPIVDRLMDNLTGV